MRNELYLEWINEGVLKLLNFQDNREGSRTEGCFYYPYWRLRKENYVNSRWQEAVLALSWHFNKFNNEEVWKRIIKGIDFWCRLQHKNGSFPEYSRSDRSFSAAAFSALAVIDSVILINYSKDNWLKKIHKSCSYMMKNDEEVLINQEAAAALALLKFGNYTKNIPYLKESERKLKIVLRNQSLKGYYLEKNGFDLGYSSLTLDLLSQYYKVTNDQRILESASRFINLVLNLDLKNSRNIRNTDWVIVNGFEAFSDLIPNGKAALKKVLNSFNVQHLGSDKNLCTDLFRLGFAYDNYKEDLIHRDLEKNIEINKSFSARNPKKILNLVRPFGIHKLRKLKYKFM